MQTQSDRLNEDVLRLNDECKLRARALTVSVHRINVDINTARVATPSCVHSHFPPAFLHIPLPVPFLFFSILGFFPLSNREGWTTIRG